MRRLQKNINIMIGKKRKARIAVYKSKTTKGWCVKRGDRVVKDGFKKKTTAKAYAVKLRAKRK